MKVKIKYIVFPLATMGILAPVSALGFPTLHQSFINQVQLSKIPPLSAQMYNDLVPDL